MMFSPGMPLLLPLGFFNILTIYAIEKYKLAYIYRKPPLLSTKLSDEFISRYFWAPVLYCTFGFWMYSNKQAFENPFFHEPNLVEKPFKITETKMENQVVVPLYNRNSIVNTNHRIFNSFYKPTMNPGWMFLIPMIIYVSVDNFKWAAKQIWKMCLVKAGRGASVGEDLAADDEFTKPIEDPRDRVDEVERVQNNFYKVM
jgi:hypothetical protein